MKIGEKTFTTRKPAELDKQLEHTGCNAADMARLLGQYPLASTVALALLPFLPEKERPSAAELAAMIGAAGVAQVAPEVAALYGAEEAPAPAASQGGAA